MLKFHKVFLLVTSIFWITESPMAVDFTKIKSGMSMTEVRSIIGKEKARDECLSDYYFFYVDRWIWAPGGIVKGYIPLTSWNGPCASGTYVSEYLQFSDRAMTIDFSKIKAGMSVTEMRAVLGTEKAREKCLSDYYFYYGDRWIWAPGGIIKGYISISEWQGPCASGTYADNFNSFQVTKRSIDFTKINAGMSLTEVRSALGQEKAKESCLSDHYVYYEDRWIWAPGGIVKGFIHISNWQGPCASGTYADTYQQF
jgi:hypothetical protein